MDIGQLEQKLLNGINLDTDGRRRQTDDDDDTLITYYDRKNFCGRIKSLSKSD